MRWPPPGLERLQGDFGTIAARAALAGAILVLPLLFVVGNEQEFASLGPFADAWWVSLVLASVGLGFAIDAFVHLWRAMRRSSRALEKGYALRTVVLVLADSNRDMGFLLQGVRHFSVIKERERGAIASLRVVAASLYVLGGLWLSIALSVGLLLAARGLISPDALWIGTLSPSAVAYLCGAVGAIVHEARVRRARRAWHNQPWADDLESDEVASWRRSGATAVGGSALSAILRRSAIAVVILAALVAFPIMTLIPTSAVGPILTSLAAPRFDRLRQRAARVEAYRTYVVQADPSITATEAGELLHVLTFVGSDREPALGEKEPSRRFPAPWLGGDDPNPMGLEPYVWGDSLFTVVAAGLTSGQREYLSRVASHPARADFSRLAHAEALDVASARWEARFPEGVSIMTMPIPSFTELRRGANAHLGAAALAMTQERYDEAETLIREVISVGFLMGDDAPTLIDNVVGFVLVEEGAKTLEALFTTTGQSQRATALRELSSAADRAASRVQVEIPEGVESWVRSLPAQVADTSAVRGLRWEQFSALTSMTPCLNMHRMVFGPDEEYQAFIERTRVSLVRWPSEEGLFEIARLGWLGDPAAVEVNLLGRVLGIPMRRGEGACGDVIRKLGTARAIF